MTTDKTAPHAQRLAELMVEAYAIALAETGTREEAIEFLKGCLEALDEMSVFDMGSAPNNDQH